MEYGKINNLLGNESENLSKFITRQYVKLIAYLIHIMKINQLFLKHLYYDRTYVVMQILMF